MRCPLSLYSGVERKMEIEMREMVKVVHLAAAILVLIFLVVACSSTGPAEGGEEVTDEIAWQDYYDLGVRYLSEGNYEEAIIAFTAAIEIDPKQAPAFVGRGYSYLGLAKLGASHTDSLNEDAIKHYELAIQDYIDAIELDNTLAEVYRQIAQIYVLLDDFDAAKAVLAQGIAATGDASLQEYWDELSDVQMKARKWEIVPFDTLTQEERAYIQDLVTALENEDAETTWALLESQSDMFPLKAYTRTELGKYRVERKVDETSAHIEIRPDD